MTLLIYIRPLELKDAQTSYVWRNDSTLWVYTTFRPKDYITQEMETKWLSESLNKPDQSRFAICVKELDTYIGNVQLININEQCAELHLFIGDKLYWNRGIGYQATELIINYGFLKRGLKKIYLKVHPANLPALYLYEKVGFEIIGKEDGLILMTITKEAFSLKY
jgi:RimJ/RimL family protein N-acetyltransferase